MMRSSDPVPIILWPIQKSYRSDFALRICRSSTPRGRSSWSVRPPPPADHSRRNSTIYGSRAGSIKSMTYGQVSSQWIGLEGRSNREGKRHRVQARRAWFHDARLHDRRPDSAPGHQARSVQAGILLMDSTRSASGSVELSGQKRCCEECRTSGCEVVQSQAHSAGLMPERQDLHLV